MPKKLFVLFLLLISASFAIAQTATEPQKTEETEKLRKAVVEFLRETSQDVGSMRSVENRISFSAELASLMWFHSEKEAKVMYGSTIADFSQLLTQFDFQMNSLDTPSDDESNPGGLFGGYGRLPVERKFRIAMAVRQQIAMSLAEHDAELAYNFFYDSANLISNEKFRKESEQADKYFEFQLMKQIAETNAAKAAQYGSASLKDGIEDNHVDLLKKIYAKDPDKGVEFGTAILSRLKTDKKSVKSLYVFSNLLRFGSDNLDASQKSGGKKAIYSRGELREIAEQFAQAVLDGGGEDGRYSALGYAEQIEKFAPGRGAQIRSKFKDNNSGGSGSLSFGVTSIGGDSAGNTFSSGTSTMSSNSNTSRNPKIEESELAEKKMMENMKILGKPLPKEERDKIIAEARKIISQTPGKDKKIAALSMLAAQVARAGDKELADEIMRDAERFVNPQPKNYQDFLFTWMLASGFAEANPEKAFALLGDAVLRVNDTIAAFIKVAEFIDITEEVIADGEIQVGMFGGSMIRGMTRELGVADATLISLAKADFTKLKGLTNSFDRVETRVLAKMMVLRALLDDKKTKAGRDAVVIDTLDAPPPPTVSRARPPISPNLFPSAIARRQRRASRR